MAELRWRSIVPQIGPVETERSYLLRLARWLRDQERPREIEIDAILAFGGTGVAERMFGFEGVMTGYSPLDEAEAVPAPAAPLKRIIVGLHLNYDGTPGEVSVMKTKGGTDFIIATLVVAGGNQGQEVVSAGGGFVTLDAADESLRILAVVGADDITWSGSYVDVD